MKVVITGGPCSGKTTLINELKKRGYFCLDEIARDVLASNKDSDTAIIQRLIFEKQIEKEKEIGDKLIFLDRGLIDDYVYFLYRSNAPDFVKNFDYKGRYNHVFLLERFPFENDGLRIEKDEEEARQIHEKIRETYENFGYKIIEVPKMNLDKRVEFVLGNIGEKR